ncbi:unnamed protein product [Ixodes pacificus]
MGRPRRLFSEQEEEERKERRRALQLEWQRNKLREAIIASCSTASRKSRSLALESGWVGRVSMFVRRKSARSGDVRSSANGCATNAATLLSPRVPLRRVVPNPLQKKRRSLAWNAAENRTGSVTGAGGPTPRTRIVPGKPSASVRPGDDRTPRRLNSSRVRRRGSGGSSWRTGSASRATEVPLARISSR